MKGIAVYLLDDTSRDKLAQDLYPPMFPKFVGHHVTFKFGASHDDPLPPAGEYWVVGYAHEKDRTVEGSGIEALVVSIDGTTDRADGSTYHITWSLGPGYSAKDSNAILKHGYMKLTNPIKINMEPAFVPFR